MKQYFFSGRLLGLSVGLAVVLGGLAVTPAFASTDQTSPIDTSGCSAPVVSQPFLSAGDSNWYTLVPGETPGNLDGSGWTLSGGAYITTTIGADGQIAQVLDLPSGSTAVSPTICVNSSDPTARTMVRNVVGTQGIHFAVSYEGTNTWTNPETTGHLHGSGSGWTLSDPFHIHPSNQSGWQLVRFTFTPGGTTSDYQIYNFYVDPRMC